MPLEIEAGRLIGRFGAPAVYGRPMGLVEMRAIALAENAERAYRGYRAAVDSEAGSVSWAEKNPEQAALVARAVLALEKELE